MRTAFDRWLAKPSTLRYLRHLIDPSPRPRRPRACLSTGQSRHYIKRGVAKATWKGNDHESELRSKELALDATRTLQAPKISLRAPGFASEVSLYGGQSLLANMISERGLISTIQHQSDVNNPELIGTLIVDEAEEKNNIDLWVEIANFRRRVDGFNGVLDVWTGMRKRNCDIPASGAGSEVLWTEFVRATLSKIHHESPAQVRLADDIYQHAMEVRTRTGASCDGLYTAIVGAWLSLRPNHALEWHHKLTEAGFTYPGAVASVGPIAMRKGPENSAFRQIYEQSTERDLYDSCMAKVFKLGNDDLALAWHRYFLSHGDRPSDEMSAKPEVQRLFDIQRNAPSASKVPRHVRRNPNTVSAQPRMLRISRSSMNTIVGDVHGIKAKEISDGFCARMLATKAFSLPIVLSGLTFLGVHTIGPQTLHQLARRADSPAAFIDIKEDLKPRGIEIGESAFSQVVLKVARIGDPALWRALLENDQHPDAYSDHALQVRLLSNFLSKEQWVNAHLALVTLSIGDPSTEHLAWNQILCHYATTGQHEAMLSTMQKIQDQKLHLTGSTLHTLYRSVLPPRQRGKSSEKTKGSDAFDALLFVTNALVYGAERGSPGRGSYVHYWMWTELLKRHGTEGRWHDLRRIVLWLVDWYSKDNSHLQVARNFDLLEAPQAVLHPHGIPRMVLTHRMVKAIFVWGFRYASRNHRLRKFDYSTRTEETAIAPYKPVDPWASGLQLLRVLWERGLPIDKVDVEKAFILCMWTLFGPGWSTIGMNNEARRLNELPLEHYIQHANEVWPGLVQGADSHLLGESTESRAELLIRLFGRARMTDKHRGEFANVEAWAEESLINGNDNIKEPSQVRGKQAVWKRSKLRHKLPETAVAVPNAPKVGGATQIIVQAAALEHASGTGRSAVVYQPMG